MAINNFDNKVFSWGSIDFWKDEKDLDNLVTETGKEFLESIWWVDHLIEDDPMEETAVATTMQKNFGQYVVDRGELVDGSFQDLYPEELKQAFIDYLGTAQIGDKLLWENSDLSLIQIKRIS